MKDIKIQKRNGIIVDFNIKKIEGAVYKCLCASDNEENATTPFENRPEYYKEQTRIYAKYVADTVYYQLQAGHISATTVDKIQDLVELNLMPLHPLAAKAYIKFRLRRDNIRNSDSALMKEIGEIVSTPSIESDMKRSNANIDGDTSMGAMLQFGATAAKAYNEQNLLTPQQAKAHREGDIHIHDFDFYALTTTCTQIDLTKLFIGGFSTGHGFLREPSSIGTYAALAAIAIQSNQNDQHGGQGVPAFDYDMAQGVHKTFTKTLLNRFTDVLEDSDTEGIWLREQAHNTAKHLISMIQLDLGGEIRIGMGNEIRENVLSACSEEGARWFFTALERAKRETEKATYQAMEGFIHNLNTMHSRAGAQTPFSSINYGTDTSAEGRMVIKNLLLAAEAGLGNGETPIFPIHIFKVKEGINYYKDDVNYDLFKLACRVSAKRLFPNFVFLDSPFNLQYYKAGHPETEVATMGCRTRVMGNVNAPAQQTTHGYNPNGEVAFGRGNLSFTTINLPRIAIETVQELGEESDSNQRLDMFYNKLESKMQLVMNQLLDRFEIQARKKVYNFPFLMGQGVWMDSDRLRQNDEIREVLKHGSLSVGFIGLAETLTMLFGAHHGETNFSLANGYNIISFMRSSCDAMAAKTKFNFSLLATPAEGLSGRFTRLDKERYGVIKGVTDKEYYTNSFHIPVGFNISVCKKIDIEAPFHKYCNAGHISYVELDGDTTNNLEAFEQVVRYMHDAKIGYGSINHPVDRDSVCGYVGVIGDVCPRCGRREGEALTDKQLETLKSKFPNAPIFN